MTEPAAPAHAERHFDLLANYSPAGGAFDELLTRSAEPREHYLPLLSHLDSLGYAELKRRTDTCRRLLHEGGITYNVYGDPRGMERPWQLDPVPFVIAAAEVAVGLAIVLAAYRNRPTVDVDELRQMKG